MAKKRKKKGNKMANFFTSRYSGDIPTDVKRNNVLSLVLFKQSTLEAIADECIPYANASEFQVHYRSIIVRLWNDVNELIVTVPTAFFNFKQTVAHASVNFEMIHEAQAAELAKSGSHAVMPILLQEFPALQGLKNYADANGFSYSIVESNSGSIHRHPGDFSFSSIDRDKSPSEPGVIYRHLNAVNAVKTDSVIYLPVTGLAKIVTTETRIVNTHESAKGILGTYTEVPTVTCILKDTTALASTVIDTFNQLLGDAVDDNPELPFKYVRASGATTKEYPLVTEILSQFAATTLKSSPDLSYVIGANIEERKFFAYNYGKKSTSSFKIWHEGKLVDAEYDRTLNKYVPIVSTTTPAVVAKTVYTPAVATTSRQEEFLVQHSHHSLDYFYNDYDDYG